MRRKDVIPHVGMHSPYPARVGDDDLRCAAARARGRAPRASTRTDCFWRLRVLVRRKDQPGRSFDLIEHILEPRDPFALAALAFLAVRGHASVGRRASPLKNVYGTTSDYVATQGQGVHVGPVTTGTDLTASRGRSINHPFEPGSQRRVRTARAGRDTRERRAAPSRFERHRHTGDRLSR